MTCALEVDHLLIDSVLIRVLESHSILNSYVPLKLLKIFFVTHMPMVYRWNQPRHFFSTMCSTEAGQFYI